MKILIFGAGELATAFARHHRIDVSWVVLLDRAACDASDKNAVLEAIRLNRPDFVINTAGKSDLTGVGREQVFRDNYQTVDAVAWACSPRIPSLHLISTAAFGSPHHTLYGPAKAAALGVVRHRALLGSPIWALSPNRMDTRMRQADWPDEDPATRLDPAREVVPVMQEIIEGLYAPGAHVVIRKVGVPGRVDKFEVVDPYEHLPSML